MSLRFSLPTLLLAACGGASGPSAPLPPPTVAVVLPAEDAGASAPPPAASEPSRLLLVKKPDGMGGSSCEVVDRETRAVIGRATSKNTAVGGSEVECLDFVADGKVIRFSNSRGIYAKDARPGANDEHALPCDQGSFADDVSSCVTLDASMLAYSDTKGPPVPFEMRLCDIARWTKAYSSPDIGAAQTKACARLVTIPRGLNRISGAPPGPIAPATWDARYCSADRLVVVAENELRLHEAPSGKLLAKVPAPKQTRIARCASGEVATTGAASANEYRVDRDTLAPK